MNQNRIARSILLPLFLGALFVIANPAMSLAIKVWHGDKVTYKGNVFETKDGLPFGVAVTVNPATGNTQTHTSGNYPIPTKINGMKIYTRDDIPNKPVKLGDLANNAPNLTSDALKEYILSKLGEQLKLLADGVYHIYIANVVVDEKGKIVYYDFCGMTQSVASDAGATDHMLSRSVQKAFSEAIAKIIANAPLHSPATVEGKDVPFLISPVAFMNGFKVQHRKVTMI